MLTRNLLIEYNVFCEHFLTFNKPTHSECVSPDDADNVMILRVEADLSDTGLGAGHGPRGGDHLPLLPEEIDKLEVRAAALCEKVLGVVRECEGDDLLALEFRTPENLASLVCLQIIDNQERPVSVFCECDQFLEKDYL